MNQLARATTALGNHPALLGALLATTLFLATATPALAGCGVFTGP